MMDHQTDRRSIVFAVGFVAIAAVTSTAVAQSTDIHGNVNFEGGVRIPQGQIEIYFEDTTTHDETKHRIAQTLIKSDGKAKTIAFSLSPPANARSSSATAQIVARLERNDGWLLARGSAQFKVGLPASITLNTVMY